MSEKTPRKPGRSSTFAPATLANAATGALAFLRKRKAKLLADVAAERKTAKDAERQLARTYRSLLREYLRTPETTYGAWIEAGVLDELEELREARRDDAVWDRLVTTYAARHGLAPRAHNESRAT